MRQEWGEPLIVDPKFFHYMRLKLVYGAHKCNLCESWTSDDPTWVCGCESYQDETAGGVISPAVVANPNKA